MPKLNVRLLRHIQKHILAEPNRFIMKTWRQKGEPGTGIDDHNATLSFPKCGTAACIGGWAVLLSKKKIRDSTNVGLKARKLLGLTPDQAANLFQSGNWPDGMGESFNWETSPKRRVKIAAKLLDNVIKTNGTILNEVEKHF